MKDEKNHNSMLDNRTIEAGAYLVLTNNQKNIINQRNNLSDTLHINTLNSVVD